MDKHGIDRLGLEAIEQYRREGYLVIRGLLTPDHVAACLDGLTALVTDPAVASGSVPGEAPFLTWEAGAVETGAAGAAGTAEARVDQVRKFGNFTDRSPAL